MKPTYQLFLLASILLFGCKADPTDVHTSHDDKVPASIENVVIEELKTDQQITQFLNNLMQLDQYYRKKYDKIQKKYGHNSPEAKSTISSLQSTDLILRKQAKKFLAVHGFPDPQKHGESAFEGILYVYHHTPDDNLLRHESLPIFYKAYKEGKLDESRFDFYLGRMYDNEFGKRLEMESPFKSADRIERYLEALKFSPN